KTWDDDSTAAIIGVVDVGFQLKTPVGLGMKFIAVSAFHKYVIRLRRLRGRKHELAIIPSAISRKHKRFAFQLQFDAARAYNVAREEKARRDFGIEFHLILGFDRAEMSKDRFGIADR